MKTLRESLAAWTDADGAAYSLAVALGMVDGREPWGGKKHVFWSNNPTGNLLYDQLQQLVALGALQYDEVEQRFKWNPHFSLE